MGVPQSFQVPKVSKGFDNKTQHTQGITQVDSLSGLKPLSFEAENGKPLMLSGLGSVMPFSCSESDFNLNLKANQSKHRYVHTGIKPYNAGNGAKPKQNFRGATNLYKCDKCVEVFLNKSTFEEHNKICKSDFKAYLDTLTYPNNTQIKGKDSGKTFACAQCDYKCEERDDMKRHMRTHNRENSYKCDECDYKCTEKEDLRNHMDTHKGKDTYICFVDGCAYECKDANLLNEHKETHKKKWSDVAKSPARNNQVSGKQTLHNKSNYNYQTYKSENSYNRKGTTNRSKGLITGSNRRSPLSVNPRPHWAYVFATGYDPRAREIDVKRDLEANLERKTGKKIYVKVEREKTRFDTYSSFKISCRLVNSEIFMDRTLWPANCKAKWYSHNRNDSNLERQ